MKPIGISDHDFLHHLRHKLECWMKITTNSDVLVDEDGGPGGALRSAKARASFSLRYCNFASLSCWSINESTWLLSGTTNFLDLITNLLPYIMDLSVTSSTATVGPPHSIKTKSSENTLRNPLCRPKCFPIWDKGCIPKSSKTIPSRHHFFRS